MSVKQGVTCLQLIFANAEYVTTGQRFGAQCTPKKKLQKSDAMTTNRAAENYTEDLPNLPVGQSLLRLLI